MPDKPPYRLFQPWNRVPELQHLPEKNRFVIWERANAASKLGCIATTLLFLWFIFLLDWYHYLFLPLFQGTLIAKAFLELRWMILLASVVAAPILLYQLNIKYGRRAVRRWIVKASHRRVPACIECGYSLIGTPDNSTQCPECGVTIPEVDQHETPSVD